MVQSRLQRYPGYLSDGEGREVFKEPLATQGTGLLQWKLLSVAINERLSHDPCLARAVAAGIPRS
jgi:hypothetical protein